MPTVNANPFKHAIAILYPKEQLPKIFETVRQQCLSTFYMPLGLTTLKPIETDLKWLLAFPFDKFRIVERFIVPADIANEVEDVHGIEEAVCWVDYRNNERYVGILSKFRYTSGRHAGKVLYSPDEKVLDKGQEEVLQKYELFFRFYKQLYDRKHRYIEEPISRQVRRAGGYLPNYREYIMIPQDDIRYATSIRSSSMIKRLKELHAVRGHLRTNWRTGEKTIEVKAHIRGAGEALQVKDYIFK